MPLSMITRLACCLAVVLSTTALPWSITARADIYLYKDENGVHHFSDQQLTSEYRLFIRQWRQPPALSATRDGASSFDVYISEAARRYNLDASLIKAVMKAESNFDAHAVSHKGARGLMQIMPQNFTYLGINDPFNPRENIMGGARYLREMLNRYGDLSLALAAYNAGPNAVDRYNAIPPFNETQLYVSRVLGYYNSLRQ